MKSHCLISLIFVIFVINKNYYTQNEDTVISFSGGRSSGFLLYKVLEAYGGTLPDYIKVIFCNTGKEMPQTLNFVEECSQRWSVPIIWLEYRSKRKFSVVNYHTASRDGEPFEMMIDDKKMLPSPPKRFCTSELKVLTIERYMKSLNIQQWTTFVGIRADEPNRVAKMRMKQDYLVPFAEDGVLKRQIIDFWKQNNFDLNLPSHGDFSNCDLCFLKRLSLKKTIIKEDPVRALWWANQEEKVNYFFRADHPSYRQLYETASQQEDFFGSDDETIACFCGD
jgi:hypothetical protein